MSKHTPGPWSITKDALGYPIVSALYQICTPSFCGVNYGELRKRPDKREEILANVHLLAAAPEMYEALQLALMVFNALPEDDESLYGPRALMLTRAALAKAEGRS